MAAKRILLCNGSARHKGTSFSFARTFKILAEREGCTADIIHIIDYYEGKEDVNHLKEKLASADIIGIIAPLYVDTLPAPTIWFLETISKRFPDELRGKAGFAVVQNGFPDITLMEPPLNTCRIFAEATGMIWLGGLAYCGGAIINGTYMEDLGKRGEKITAGFKMALDDMLQGRTIPPEAQNMIELRIPRIAYWPMACMLNRYFRKQARKAGIKDLRAKPLLE